MNYAQVIKFFGSATRTAEENGIGLHAVMKWRRNGRIPMERQHIIAHLSGHVLKADPIKVTPKPHKPAIRAGRRNRTR